MRAVAAGLVLVALLGGWWLAALGAGDGRSVGVPGGSGVPRGVGPEEGSLAPDFDARDGEGNRFRLSEYRGQPVLVNFWAPWCPSCVAELPAIQQVLDHHRDQGFAVIAVDEGGDTTAAKRYLEERGLSPRLALDPEGSIARLYGVVGLPASFFIDRAGIIRTAWYGEMSPRQVHEFAHLILETGKTEALVGPGRRAVGLDVLLEPEGPGTLYLLSVVIRCDESYCANHLLEAVRATPGVIETRGVPQEGNAIAIFVRFDPDVGTPESVVAAFREALATRPDPMFGDELVVRYLRPVGETVGA
jgi:peroxiredoxin